MNELNHTAGKGDKERSPGWRKNYEEINFPPATGFARRGNRLVKAYGGRKAVFNYPEINPSTGHQEGCGCLGCVSTRGVCDCRRPGYVSVGECVCERPTPADLSADMLAQGAKL